MIVEVPSTEIAVEDTLDVSVGSCEVEVVDLADLDVTVSKKEYVITGDDIYVPMLYDDAPQWMKDLVQVVVDVAVESNSTDLINSMTAIVSEFATSYVPLNQYTQSIIDLGDEDTRINGLITTLNSNLSDGLSSANAQIIEMQLTKASKSEVVAQIIQTLSAQLADETSSLGATVGRIDQAIADETSARARSFAVVMASLDDTNLDVTANASATTLLNAYVGIDTTGGLTGTGLLADVELIQNQLDGVIETTTGTYNVITYTLLENGEIDPASLALVTAAEPYASWIAAEASGSISVRSTHIGDTYIKYTVDPITGVNTYDSSYKFIKTIPDSTGPNYGTDADGFTWSKILDQVSEEVYVTALAALDLADSKRRVFVATPVPPYDIGDLWLVQTGAGIIGTTQGGRVIQAGDMLRCAEDKVYDALAVDKGYEHNDWIPADNYRESMNAIQADLDGWRTGTYAPFASAIQSQVDKKSETFYQSSVPSGRETVTNVVSNSELDSYVGDLWKNTNVGTVGGYLGKNTEYVYTKTVNGANWNYGWTKMEVPDIVFDTIDTKKSIYTGDTNPISFVVAPDVVEENDMWITGSGVVGFDKESVYVWDGSAWTKPLRYTDDTAVTVLSNGLANGTTTIKLTNAFIGDTALTDYIVNEVDSKVGVYSGTTAPVNGQPSGVMVNDIYIWFTTGSKVLANGTIQTYDVNRTYKYSGTVWNEITTNSNITALADLADGKRTVFSGNTVPVGAVENDIWIPSAANGAYLQGEIYQYNGASWVIATKYSSDIAALSKSIQTQLDGKITTTYGGATPPITNQTEFGPKSANRDDYWYCDTNGEYEKGKVYKYEETEGTGADSGKFKYTWKFSSDISKEAFDLADGKSAIFTTESQPSVYSKNDMMIVVGTFNNGTTAFSDGVVLTATVDSTSFVAAHWVKKINDTEDLDEFVSATYTPTITNLQNQVDSQIQYWYNTVATTAAAVTTQLNSWKVGWTTDVLRLEHHGDIGVFTKRGIQADGSYLGEAYYYDRKTAAWALVNDNAVVKALMSAANAQATADGVVVSYYAIKQDTAPATSSLWLNKTGTKVLKKYTTSWVNVTVKQGDTLTAYDSATKDTSIYLYNSGNWITETENGLVASAEAVTNLEADLGSLGGTVSGHTSQLSTVDARIANGVATVDSKWVYNSNLIIGGVKYTSGFGLVSTFTGTPNPNNPPAGTSEFWISADKFKLTTTGYNGTKYKPFTVNGTTGEITFNGKVSFTNTTGVPDFVTSSELVDSALVTTFYQTAAPTTGMKYGDYWLDTDSTGYLVYRYQGTGGANTGTLSWVSSSSATAKSLQNAYKAQKVADGKVNTYYQATAPAGALVTGDIWIETDNNYKQYRWSGSSWVALAYNPATAVNAGTTTINGGKIEALTITATQIAADSVSADRLKSTTGASTVWEGGGLISANFNGNVNGNIGTPTAGFRLSSNAAGTSTDPNIYGAYIKGATLEGSALNINDVKVVAEGYPNNFGPVLTSKTSTASNGGAYAGTPYLATTPIITLYARGYSSGYNALRCCSATQNIIIKASSSGWSNFSNGLAADTSIEVQYRYGTGSWVSLGIVENAYAGKAVSYINQGFVIPATSSISFRAIGGNLAFVYTDIDVLLINSNA